MKHRQLLSILFEIGLNVRDVRIIRNLYEKRVATIRVWNEEIDQVEICRGVRQGGILSPLLFNVYSEGAMWKAFENLEAGIKINGKINNLRYELDTVLIAASTLLPTISTNLLKLRVRILLLHLAYNHIRLRIVDFKSQGKTATGI